MPLKRYGVLKGTVTGHLRDADDDHYQVLVRAGTDVYRIAVNVKSSAPKAPSTLLFLARGSLPDDYVRKLHSLKAGYTRLPSKAGGLALDYVRSARVTRASMKEVPPDEPGADNDLKDKIEGAVVSAMDHAGSVIYAFGERWGPEKGKRDQYFKFVPGNGVHDIHMNQGSSGKYKKYNGTTRMGQWSSSTPTAGCWRSSSPSSHRRSRRTSGGIPERGPGRGRPPGGRRRRPPVRGREGRRARRAHGEPTPAGDRPHEERGR